MALTGEKTSEKETKNDGSEFCFKKRDVFISLKLKKKNPSFTFKWNVKPLDTRYKITIFAISSLNYSNIRILFLLSENVYHETYTKNEKCVKSQKNVPINYKDKY